mmetsp:Transcript_5503/g.5392  ORF Transcript_5503/g.5392 Transcript_5503/m.5392 type:complete len:97 (-) Transcript_5503:46-336(-)
MRLGLMILAAIPTVRQYYMYMLDPKVTRLGTQCLVFCLTIVSEDVLIFKTLPELPPIPKENMIGWCLFIVLYILFSVSMLLRRGRPSQVNANKKSQ